MGKELTVTGLTRPDNYNGEPCVITIEITGEDGEVYEADMHFDAGVTNEGLKEAAYNTLLMLMPCEAVAINIKSFKIKRV